MALALRPDDIPGVNSEEKLHYLLSEQRHTNLQKATQLARAIDAILDAAQSNIPDLTEQIIYNLNGANKYLLAKFLADKTGV